MENNRASYLKKEENGTSIVFSASRIFTLCSVLILALVLVGKLMREREKERERRRERGGSLFRGHSRGNRHVAGTTLHVRCRFYTLLH